jgi:hypothetical protein
MGSFGKSLLAGHGLAILDGELETLKLFDCAAVLALGWGLISRSSGPGLPLSAR